MVETEYLYALLALQGDAGLTGEALQTTLHRLESLEALAEPRRWVVTETMDFLPASEPGFFWRSSMTDLVSARMIEGRLALLEAVDKPWPEFHRWATERTAGIGEPRTLPWLFLSRRPDRANAAIIEALLLPNLADAIAAQDAVQSSRRLAHLALTVQRDHLDARQVETLLAGLAPDLWTGGRIRQEADGNRPLALEVVGAREQWSKELRRLAPPFRWTLCRPSDL